MSRMMNRIRGLWSRIPKSAALVAIATLVVASAVTITTSSAASAATNNSPPIAYDSTVTTTMDTPVRVTLPATDPDGDPMFPQPGDGKPPSHGTFHSDGGTTLTGTYTPDPGFIGTDTWVWIASDPYSDSNTATLTINVLRPDPPATPDQTVETTYGDWTGPEPSCDAPTVEQTRTVSTITTTYEWVWNSDTNQYDKVEHRGASVPGDPETRTVTYQGSCPTNPPFEEYETTVWWQMDTPNLSDTTSYEWPQTRLSGEPEATCTLVKVQFDKYWISSADDEAYLAGLTKLNSPADDARLSPHGYYAKIVVLPASECVTPPETPKDASASIIVIPATCKAAGSVSWGKLVNAVATDLNQSVGTNVATSPAIEGHLFPDGTTVWEYQYTIEPKLTGKDCDSTPPVNPGGGTTPPTDGGSTPPVTTPVDTQQASPVDAVTRTPEAPVTGGVGDSGAEGYLWGALALLGLGGVVAFGLRRRHA